MSSSPDLTLRNLDDCGCCEGISADTPAVVFNRPGLSAIAYRTGTHAQFKETMLSRLSASREPALRGLNTRADDDFSIALLDAWAVVADVLTFYQERIANESYLRTATERLSILELARLIGYELSPGVAASTYLAFTLEDAPGAFAQAISLSNIAQNVPETPPPVTIDGGVKVQSVPGPGETAQNFETVEKIEARIEWNAIRPRLTQPQKLKTAMGSVVFEGTSTTLKPGDKLLINATGGREVRTVSRVTIDDVAQTTRIDFESPELSPATLSRPANLPVGTPGDFPASSPFGADIIEEIIKSRWSEDDLSSLVAMQQWSAYALASAINREITRSRFTGGTEIVAFRQRAAVFGYNAPNYDLLTAALRTEQEESIITIGKAILSASQISLLPAASSSTSVLPPNWEGRTIEQDSETSGNVRTLDLDSEYEGIAKESWLILTAPIEAGAVKLATFRIRETSELSRSDYTISAKVSRLKVDSSQPFDSAFKIRNSTAFVRSEPLAIARVPVVDVVAGNELTLDGCYLGLKKGRKVILTGEREDLKGVIESELLSIKEMTIEAGFSFVVFETALVNRYVRSTVTINANVTRSTHGETVQETLGSGDATQVFQRFTLRQPPITYIAAPTPTGGLSTLEIRVNDILWTEVQDFFSRGSDERIYITRHDDEGRTTVIFGDGITGSRLPTGLENVKARYRKGIGLGGLVKAHGLSQLMTRPLGVKGVTNPLAAGGAEDREQFADARRNAPLTVLTLGRVVSLKDYEDFARAFSGIAKALATWSWSGEQRAVFLTVAGVGGTLVSNGSDLANALETALLDFGDPHVQLRVESYQPRFFRLGAAIQVAPEYLVANVLTSIEAETRRRFSFESRELGQPVHLSEVINVMQAVPGVVSVLVTAFHRSELAVSVKSRLAAARPALSGADLFAAELLTLDSRPLTLEVTV